MKISKTSIDELNATVRLKVEKQDYEATVNEKLKEYKKKVNMPGFRKGMVPAGLIKRMYGKSILAEQVNQILGSELSKYITDEKLNILGEPLPNTEEPLNINFDTDEEFEFVFDLGLAPEINIDLGKMGELPWYEIEVDEDLVEKQIEGYTSRFGENVPAEQVGEKETMNGDFAELDETGNPKEGGIKAENVFVSPQLMNDQEIKSRFQGAKVGDVIKFNPKTAFANDHEVAHLLKIKHEDIEGLNSEFNFTITKINTFIPAEINEDLFKKVYGEESEIKTIDDFRQKIKEELQTNLKYSSEYKFLLDAKESLIKQADMKLPEEFLKRWLLETNKKVTREQIDQEFDQFRKDLQWTLIKNKLIRENEIKVNEEDIREMATEMAKMQFRQYGMFNIPTEYLDNYANSILKNEEEKHRMIEKKSEDKVLALIKEKAPAQTKKISQKEFDDLFEK
jgi:trigger factor